jgi:2-polyprenyl-3-methyl-5-hydroxy-6-metoxy-1,4-benzoquinol methylase
MLPGPLETCPLCGDPRFREKYSFEPALWIPGRVVSCSACGAVYKKPSADARPLWDYYRDASYRELRYWSFEEPAARALRRIRDSVISVVGDTVALSLLEVGCGTGEFLQLAQQRGFEVSGVELNAGHAAQARDRTGGSPILCGDFMTESFSRQFDVIAMLDLIEHVPDPLAALRRSHDLLKPGGHLVVYTPNHGGITARVADLAYRASGGSIAGPVIEIFDCLHVVFFDVNSLRSAFEQSGFRMVKLFQSPYDPARNDQATGASAVVVRMLEALGSVCFGQFRMLMFGQKPAAAV